MTTAQKTQAQTALTAAYHDYAVKLNSYAFFKVHDRLTSEDLVQVTFIKTWKYLAKGGNVSLMKAFLYRILNNLIVDEYRKHEAVSLDNLIERGFEPSNRDFGRQFNILDGKAAVLLIEHLPRMCRKVMRMRYVQELSNKEISIITGQSTNAISVQTYRGLRKLKLLYDNGFSKIPSHTTA